MAKWFVTSKRADFEAWAKKFGISPVTARILRNRDLTEEEEVRKFLYGDLKDCHSPWLLKDMDTAVNVIGQAVCGGRKIRVIGDYDVDGICSAFILTKGIQVMGGMVDTVIPHRIHDGYGLNENLIREASADGVELILTCDNGIAAAPQISLAKELGMDVVVTDHHEVPFVMEDDIKKEILPEALAVVDPKREEDTYPFPGICGAVVALKVIQALADKKDAWGADETANGVLAEAIEEFLEFAAFATVCDVMELRDENRILVKEGLERMKNSRNPGLKALLTVNDIKGENLSAYHLGFVLGPCLNATGRLDTASRSMELLRCADEVSAMQAAGDLKRMNESRKNLTLQGLALARKKIHEENMEQDKVLVIFLPEVHESLAGIIAGKVKEEINRPVIVLTKAEDGVKGSGRSIEKYHMYEALSQVKKYFTKFGGHKMAAGLSLREEDIENLRRDLNENCTLEEGDFEEIVHIDVPMPVDYYGAWEIAKELELLEPFGVGNPKPLFAHKDLIFQAGKRFGKENQYSRFRVRTQDGEQRELIWFGNAAQFESFLDRKFGEGSARQLFAGQGHYPVTVAYQLGRKYYMGNEELQYLMQKFC